MQLPPIDTSVEDIAVGLHGVQRWGGRTMVPWNVLQHTLAMFSLCAADKPVDRMAILFHDANEAITGADIRHGFKTAEQQLLEQGITSQIYEHVLQLPEPSNLVKGRVKALDNLVACAECDVLLPPDMRSLHRPNFKPNENASGAEWVAVTHLLGVTRTRQIQQFLDLYKELSEERQIKNLSVKGK
jgi:hypothetical protein